ncbi:hypothetical protein ACFQU2_32345 [Siccirubricoccus deserti]
MAEFDLVIRNGTVATASDVFAADVGITDGQVVALARGLGPGTREIDADGKLVLPGGIDSHTHIEEPRGGPTVNADDFASGSASAAVGEPPPSLASPGRRAADRWPRALPSIMRGPGKAASTTASTWC